MLSNAISRERLSWKAFAKALGGDRASGHYRARWCDFLSLSLCTILLPFLLHNCEARDSYVELLPILGPASWIFVNAADTAAKLLKRRPLHMEKPKLAEPAIRFDPHLSEQIQAFLKATIRY